MRQGQPWKVAAWEIVHLGSCHLGKAIGKVPYIFETTPILLLLETYFKSFLFIQNFSVPTYLIPLVFCSYKPSLLLQPFSFSPSLFY